MSLEEGINDQLVLIVGKSSTGKSASLEGLKDHKRVAVLNCENGKRLPFKSKDMKKVRVLDPLQLPPTMDAINAGDTYDVIVVDTLTFLMDMYETQHVLTSSNTMAA